MDFLNEIWSKAKKLNRRIVLPESNDIRTIKATELILKSKLAQVYLIGNENEIQRMAGENSINISGASIINPLTSQRLSEYIKAYKVKRDTDEGYDIQF